MKLRLIILSLMLCLFYPNLKAQTDDDFYTVKEEKLQKKYFRELGRPDLTVGVFYGNRPFYFEDKGGSSKYHLDMNGIKGASVSIENPIIMGELKAGFGDDKTMFAARGYLGILPLKWRSRFSLYAYAGIGYSGMLVKEESKSKLLGTFDLGAKLRMRYFITDHTAIYTGAYWGFLVGGKSTYKEEDMASWGSELDFELGLSFVM